MKQNSADGANNAGRVYNKEKNIAASKQVTKENHVAETATCGSHQFMVSAMKEHEQD